MPKAGERRERPDADYWMLALWARRERHQLALERRTAPVDAGARGSIPAQEYRVVCTCGWSSPATFTRPDLSTECCAVWSALDRRAARLEGDVRERMNWSEYERRTQHKSEQRWERLTP